MNITTKLTISCLALLALVTFDLNAYFSKCSLLLILVLIICEKAFETSKLKGVIVGFSASLIGGMLMIGIFSVLALAIDQLLP